MDELTLVARLREEVPGIDLASPERRLADDIAAALTAAPAAWGHASRERLETGPRGAGARAACRAGARAGRAAPQARVPAPGRRGGCCRGRGGGRRRHHGHRRPRPARAVRADRRPGEHRARGAHGARADRRHRGAVGRLRHPGRGRGTGVQPQAQRLGLHQGPGRHVVGGRGRDAVRPAGWQSGPAELGPGRRPSAGVPGPRQARDLVAAARRGHRAHPRRLAQGQLPVPGLAAVRSGQAEGGHRGQPEGPELRSRLGRISGSSTPSRP